MREWSANERQPVTIKQIKSSLNCAGVKGRHCVHFFIPILLQQGEGSLLKCARLYSKLLFYIFVLKGNLDTEHELAEAINFIF